MATAFPNTFDPAASLVDTVPLLTAKTAGTAFAVPSRRRSSLSP